MGAQVKSNTPKNKNSNKSTGNPKKKNMKNKNKKNDVKATQKNEAKTSQSIIRDKGIYPSMETAFKAFLSARLCAAMWNHIPDCDETYNYWEPSHFLLYGKGFQTWEYSPDYALRSYTYLLLHVVPAWIYVNLLQPNRILIFYFIRCLLGSFCAFCEAFFYKAVSKEFGVDVGRMIVGFMLFSPGMFISSSAFLPSSFSMYMCLLSTGAWISKKYEFAIFTVALSTFVSWPFAALLGAPIALDMLIVRKDYLKFFQWSLISTVIILTPIIKMDSEVYGRFVAAPFNIVLYNVFSNHGPNLYGTEPICFYLINGILNFNLIFIAAILAPSFLLLRNFLVTQAKRKGEFFNAWLILAPFYIWFVVFTLQPHKEERFLFPVYPLICLCGAICIDSIEIIYSITAPRMLGKFARQLANSNFICIAAVLLSIVLGLSRIVALHKGYHAPMDVWMELSRLQNSGKLDPEASMNVCVGKEWHRFPTRFFLPNNNWNVRFLQSEFKGQLPAEYSPYQNATAIVHTHFNDMNQEEVSRYFDVDKCDFLIDCDFGKSSELEPNYSLEKDKWTIVFSRPFLNSEKSNPFFRAFYIPFVSDNFCTYANYNLLQSKKFEQMEEKEKEEE